MTEKQYQSLRVGDRIITTSGFHHIVRAKYKDMIGVDAPVTAEKKDITKDGFLPIAIYACQKED